MWKLLKCLLNNCPRVEELWKGWIGINLPHVAKERRNIPCGVLTGIKGRQAAQQSARSPWRRWKELSAGATERSTGRRSSGTHTTTQSLNHGLGRWVMQAISCNKQSNSPSTASVYLSSMRLFRQRNVSSHNLPNICFHYSNIYKKCMLQRPTTSSCSSRLTKKKINETSSI